MPANGIIHGPYDRQPWFSRPLASKELPFQSVDKKQNDEDKRLNIDASILIILPTHQMSHCLADADVVEQPLVAMAATMGY